jgi:hypothetical protein
VGRSEGAGDLKEDIASRNPKSKELEGDELCCLSKAKRRNAVTACTFCLSTAKSRGVYQYKKVRFPLGTTARFYLSIVVLHIGFGMSFQEAEDQTNIGGECCVV